MLSVPPSTRVALGTLEVGGQRLELFLSAEWARYFQSLNTQVQENGSVAMQGAPQTALFDDGVDAPDLVPGPPGQPGAQGEPGLALFMLQDDAVEQSMLSAPGPNLSAPPAIGNSTPAAGSFTDLSATGDLALGVVANTGGTLNRTTYQRGYATVPQYRYITNHAGAGWLGWGSDGVSAMIFGQASGSNGAEAVRWMALTGSGAAIAAGFGCNGKAPQAAAASGGTLAGVIAALVANGILSS